MVNLTRPKYLFPLELKPTNSVESGSYITSAGFHGENNVAIIWLNRNQNISVIVTCKPQNNYNCTDVSMFGWFAQCSPFFDSFTSKKNILDGLNEYFTQFSRSKAIKLLYGCRLKMVTTGIICMPAYCLTTM